MQDAMRRRPRIEPQTEKATNEQINRASGLQNHKQKKQLLNQHTGHQANRN